MAAGVEIEHGQPQLLGTLHLVEKCVAAFLQGLLVGRAEVDEVAVVGQHILWLEAPFGEQLAETVNFFLPQGFANPAALVAGEERKGIGPNRLGIEDGVAHTT